MRSDKYKNKKKLRDRFFKKKKEEAKIEETDTIETIKEDSFFKEFIKDLIIALAITGAILLFVGPTTVKEHSMEPTINDGDYLILSKLLYTNPQVGDIIVFKTELKNDDGKNMNLIKRVIGVEGDIITITNGKLYRNGSLVEEDYIYGECTGEVYNYIVPEGMVYVLGDHREVSRDSRELGAIDTDTIIGKVILRVYPFSQFGTVE